VRDRKREKREIQGLYGHNPQVKNTHTHTKREASPISQPTSNALDTSPGGDGRMGKKKWREKKEIRGR
jgi:hypothetical protein